MDDLKMLRDLGRDLEHEPPATLIAQRNRLGAARPRRRLRGWMMISLAALATALAVAVPNLFLMSHKTVPLPVGARPMKITGALNILLVGSDNRSGMNQALAGQRSDTLIIVHIPEDRQKVTAVNLPRDLMVKTPECGGGKLNMINAAFNAGGLGCAVQTVESVTNLRIDHAMSMEFGGFKEIVDALGGVEITVPKAIDDPKSKLTLAPGKQVLDGDQALGWMRLRRFGDGSDLARIKRQQVLMKALVVKAKKSLADPGRLRDFVQATQKWVTTTEGFGMETMYAVATEVDGSTPVFRSVPVEAYTADPNRLQLAQPQAEKLFAELR
ncbi:LCP family protein [Nonomuraea sp. NPDC050556]|uniref:LCP family protein n=1 Tax=Nonomuraea sp. NPDC050556 TaxID=3364369 RepID=UPI0037BCB168